MYPGCTEDTCIPIMEKASGLKCGVDFKIGYSPERINPGDRVHRLENIKKVVSGCDEEALDEIKHVYDIVIEAGLAPKKSKVVILGLTFKENCPDTRNSKVNDIVKQLHLYGITPVVIDPWADEEEAIREYGIQLTKLEAVKDADCVIVAVAHNAFRFMGLVAMKLLYKEGPDDEKVLLDVKGLYKVSDLEASGMRWWRL